MKKRESTLLIVLLCIGSILLIFHEQIRILLMIFLLWLAPNEETWIDLDDHYQYLNRYGSALEWYGYPEDGLFYEGDPFIFPIIEEYKFDINYITIKQKYSKQYSSKLLEAVFHGCLGKGINTNVFPVYDSAMYYAFEKYYEIEKTTMKVRAFCDSVVVNNPYFKEMEKNDYNYYIIEKHDVVKHGPFSRNEFEAKFVFLSLPSNLWIYE